MTELICSVSNHATFWWFIGSVFGVGLGYAGRCFYEHMTDNKQDKEN